MTFSCLVCGRPSETTHLGMDACRACTVFYRRHRAKRDRMKCFSDYGNRPCINYHLSELTFACRKCRLRRFEDVMRAGAGDASANTNISPTHSNKQNGTIQNHSPLECSIIQRIKANHHKLSAFRRSGELNFRGIRMNPAEVNRENYELVPCTYQSMNEGTRILIGGLFNFAMALFPEFRILSTSEKWLLIRNYQKIFHCLDSQLRALRRFGKKSFFAFGTYTTFLSSRFADDFFSDCSDQRNAKAAAKTLYSCIQDNIATAQKHIYQIDPNDDEFLALIGLALWSVDNIEPSEHLLAMAARYRTQIVTELTAHYRRSVGDEKGAGRIGSLMCLLQHLRRVEMNLKSEFEIYRMLDVFDDDTLMYKLQIHR